MQSFNTDSDDAATPATAEGKLTLAGISDLQPGACARVALPDGNEIAVCNVGGEFYAIDNSCPHRGAPLSEGALHGYMIECWLHGWQFDVRTGECLTVTDRVKTYEVMIEDGAIIVKT